MKPIYISLISYFFIAIALIKLPEQFWDLFLKKINKLLVLIKRIPRHMPIIKEIIWGEELLVEIQESEQKIAFGSKILPKQLIEYKFYSALLEQVFDSNRKLGIGVKKIIGQLRKALIADLQFERKICSECVGTILQFAVISLTTWSFVFLSGRLVNIPLSKLVVLAMLSLQFFGVGLFFLALNKAKSHIFQHFENVFLELYSLTIYLEVGLPLNECLERSQVMQASLMNAPGFSPFATRTRALMERLKVSGISPKEELQEIIEGIWHFQSETFIKFTKIVQVLKFTILAFFFLPAYFLYLYSIFQFFMEQ